MTVRHLVASTLTAAALATTSGVTEAAPPERSTERIVVEELNPCTGEVGRVDIAFDIARCDNRRNSVLTIATSSIGADGWAGTGTDTLVISERGLIEAVNLRITSPDGGGFFVVKRTIKLDAHGLPELVRSTVECRR